jgi:uncharacterized protein YkwD
MCLEWSAVSRSSWQVWVRARLAPLALGAVLALAPLAVLARAPTEGELAQPPEHPYADVEQRLLEVINAARAAAGLPPVAWDPVAAEASLAHARQMAEAGYLSHWDLQGRLPHERYASYGGRAYVAENAGCWSGARGDAGVTDRAVRLQQIMLDERPPEDGHRANILDPDRTAVGIGVAFANGRLCMTNEFLNQYLTLDGLPEEGEVGQSFELRGVVAPGYTLAALGLGYLPPATPMSTTDLNGTHNYTPIAPTYRWLAVHTSPDGSFQVTASFDNPAGAGRYQVFALVTDANGRRILAANPMVDAR